MINNRQFELILQNRELFKKGFTFQIFITSPYPSLDVMEQNDNKLYEMFRKKYYEDLGTDFGFQNDSATQDRYEKQYIIKPTYGKICAIAISVPVNEVETPYIFHSDDEREVLNRIVQIFQKPNVVNNFLIGYSLYAYNLPYMLQRFKYNNIPIPEKFLTELLQKPFLRNFVDLVEVTNFGGRYFNSFEESLHLFNIEHTYSFDIQSLAILFHTDKEEYEKVLREYITSMSALKNAIANM